MERANAPSTHSRRSLPKGECINGNAWDFLTRIRRWPVLPALAQRSWERMNLAGWGVF